MPKIMEAHSIPYVATANAAYPLDIYDKFKRAKDMKGTRYIHIISACPPGWGYDPKDTIEIGRLATETGFWPLYEVINGKFILSQTSKKHLDKAKRKPIEEYFKAQKRFRNVTPEEIKAHNEYIDDVWKEIKRRIEE